MPTNVDLFPRVPAQADNRLTRFTEKTVALLNGLVRRRQAVPAGPADWLLSVRVVEVLPPADADLAPGEAVVWLDPTAGAAKLMVKAKDAAGTVVAGSVTLS